MSQYSNDPNTAGYRGEPPIMPPKVSDTPRTDREAMGSSLTGTMMADMVDADFARKT
jgi:hypothetical protein